MSHGDRTVRKELHFLRFTPFARSPFALIDLRAEVFAVDGFGVREEHHSPVGRETAHAHFRACGTLRTTGGVVLLFVFVRIPGQTLHRHDVFPLPGGVLTGLIELEKLLTRYVARTLEGFLAAFLFLLTVTREHDRIVIVADEHRCKITGTLLIELFRLRHFVSGSFPFPLVYLRTGVLAGFDRDRETDRRWHVPIGFLSELGVGWKKVGLSQLVYIGGRQQYYGEAGRGKYYWGDAYYRSPYYLRTDLSYQFLLDQYASLKCGLAFHVTDKGVRWNQMLQLNVSFGR